MALNFPRYWARGTAGGVSCWWWSNRSADEAKQIADAKAIERQQWAKQNLRTTDKRGDHYGYGDKPLRELVIEELADKRGELTAVLTRNSYGSLVLNTAQAMFVDIDLPHKPRPPRGFFSLLFGKPVTPETVPQEEVIQHVSRWVEGKRGYGARLYETKAGLRLLVTHDLFDPTSREAATAFSELRADRLYQKLCVRQQCFRARVTPKPWRCDAGHPPASWPFEDASTAAAFNQWLEGYNSKATAFASCRFLKSLGDASIHPELAKIIELHDRLSGATSGRPLA